MSKIYNEEFIKALASMISRDDFNGDIEKSDGCYKHKFKSRDLNKFFEHIDLNQSLNLNSLELDMLTGNLNSLSFIDYYNKEEYVNRIDITILDLLLYSSIKNKCIFNKIIKIKNIDFSNVIYTVDKLLWYGDIAKLDLLIEKGINLNNTYPGTKMSIVEFYLINSVVSLSILSRYNKNYSIKIIKFILNNKSNIDTNLFINIKDILIENVNTIKSLYPCNININPTDDIFLNIEKFMLELENIEF